MVEDPRYTGKMMVVGFTCDTDRVQQGITLKDIYITKVNGQVINQPAGKVCNTCFCTNIPANEAEKYNTLTDLAIIAKFFNGSWKKTTNNNRIKFITNTAGL